MKISELLQEQTFTGEIDKISDSEIEVVDSESGIKTTVPVDPDDPGTIARNEKGELTLDPETVGDVAKDIKRGEKITVEPGGAKGTQGTQGTV